MALSRNRLLLVLNEISEYYRQQLVPFWLNNSVDTKYGGFLTTYDGEGNHLDIMDKMIVANSRMVWGMSTIYQRTPERKSILEAARQGFQFLVDHFWDAQFGGWFWKVKRDGSLLDDGKILYGHSFAIYALSQYYLVSGDNKALAYASDTFDLLQKYATDTLNGGYFENFERDWQLCEAGFAGGDRKCLDIHLHLMEALTVLSQASGSVIHKRKLEELILLIVTKMINNEDGCAFNQFDLSFTPIPAINIKRTWNVERNKGAISRPPANATAFGYSIELSWLLNRAGEVLGKPEDYYNRLTKKLVDHTLMHGFDHERGGLFCEGTHDGIILSYDKEFWQNTEALIGFLDSYERTGLDKYLEAFYLTWDFCFRYFVNKKTGEWNQLVSREGKVLIDELNQWRSAFHTVRAMVECMERLKKLTALQETKNGRLVLTK